MIAPAFEKHSIDNPSVCFASVECDDADDVSQKLGIRAMPTFILYKNGQEVKRTVSANIRDLQNLVQTGLQF